MVTVANLIQTFPFKFTTYAPCAVTSKRESGRDRDRERERRKEKKMAKFIFPQIIVNNFKKSVYFQ